MKIGIIVYSQTGNTLSVAKELKEELEKGGHETAIERIWQADESNRDPQKMIIKNMPDINKYEIIILGAPVQAFTLAAMFRCYLRNIKSAEGKKVLCYVTKGLATKAFGGNKSINIMEKNIEQKGGSVLKSAIIIWKDGVKEKQIAEMKEDFLKTIK